jgi:hypothetical protein
MSIEQALDGVVYGRPESFGLRSACRFPTFGINAAEDPR